MAHQRVSDLLEFVDTKMNLPFFIGVDVHKKTYHVAMLRFDGAIKTWVSPSKPKTLIDTLKALPCTIGDIAYEAGPTGFGLARAIPAASLPVTVVAPSRVPRPAVRGNKTDRLDCIKLAEYASKGLLKPIAIPTEEEEAERSLVRRRHDLADSIRSVKQRIHSHLLFLEVEEPQGLEFWSNRAIAQLEKLALEPAARLTLMSLVRELKFLQAEKSRVQRMIAQIAKKKKHQEVIDCLRSVPGIGQVVATTFRMELFRPERFQRSEEVTSFLGLAPVVRQSGQGKPGGRLIPAGQTRLRSLLVEAAWIWKKKDLQAEARYRKLLARSGLAQKAITALARKLAVILWRLSLEKRHYQLQQTD